MMAERTDFYGSNTPKCPKSPCSFQKTACSFHSFELILSIRAKKKSPKNLDFSGFFGGELGIRTLGSFWEHSISSLVRTWYFRVCCGRWRQFWKRRKSLCCNGFRTHRPVLTSSISEKTRVQIEMRNAPKRSIFLRAGKKIRKKKTLVRYGFADSHPD